MLLACGRPGKGSRLQRGVEIEGDRGTGALLAGERITLTESKGSLGLPVSRFWSLALLPYGGWRGTPQFL